MISSYSSPFNVGHNSLERFWDGDLVVQEKIDGSQFSFAKINGTIHFRSRKAVIMSPSSGMFKAGVDHILERGERLHDGLVFRAEFLQKPKHNTIAYERIPRGHIILFDMDVGDQAYAPLSDLAAWAEVLEVEAVPHFATLSCPPKPTIDDLAAYLERDSVLGGDKVEGIVLKNYRLYGSDDKVLMAKLVRAEFKEAHRKDWKERNPGADFIQKVAEDYGGPPRWRKAVQHLKEAGTIQGAPQDIPALLQEIRNDVMSEAGAEIAARLLEHYSHDIQRYLTHGFPEWWKQTLLEDSLRD